MCNNYPKLESAEMLTNNMLKLVFENGDVRYLRSHLLNEVVDSYSLSKGKNRKVMLFGTPYMSAFGTEYEIKPDGTLILNGKDVYTPKELWEDSKLHIYS